MAADAADEAILSELDVFKDKRSPVLEAGAKSKRSSDFILLLLLLLLLLIYNLAKLTKDVYLRSRFILSVTRILCCSS